MSSFYGTCSVSCLPIRPKDPVRYLLLTRNPFAQVNTDVTVEHDIHESMEGLWLARTFPIRAEYDGYGSIRAWEDSLSTQVILDAFRFDLVERGTGANQLNDVPTILKDMDFEDLLAAVRQRRVIVRAGHDDYAEEFKEHQEVLQRVDELLRASGETPPEGLLRKPEPKPVIHDGIPTLQRVTDILERHGIKVNDNENHEGVYCTEVSQGVVRIREAGFGHIPSYDMLHRTAALLNDYATVLVAGTEDPAELMVYPRPQKTGDCYLTRDVAEAWDKQHLMVASCMIREDVWQALLKMRSHWHIESVLDGAREAFRAQTDSDYVSKEDHTSATSDNISRALYPGLGHVSPSSHWKILARRARKGEVLPAEQLTGFLDAAAEFMYCRPILAGLRRVWTPFNTFGASDPDRREVGRAANLQSEFYETMSFLARHRSRQGSES